jgi:hypothetical protein
LRQGGAKVKPGDRIAARRSRRQVSARPLPATPAQLADTGISAELSERIDDAQKLGFPTIKTLEVKGIAKRQING